VYLELPGGFATQVAITERPLAECLPRSPWFLLGDMSVKPIWQSFGLPMPEVFNWVKTSEATKRMEVVVAWLEHWAAHNIQRSHTLVVVGGGVMTDMGGLAASLYMRGITWHTWPSSLLAQIDAGIGGKTAVNLDCGKNLVGSFHHPQRAVIATGFLDSLSERQRKSGIWELVKMALVEGDISWAESLLECEKPATDDLERAVRLKIDIVHADFKECFERRLLNLGHTLGHALESASDFELLHGEAVGLGTLAACLMSESSGNGIFPTGFVLKMIGQLSHLADRIPTWEKCLPYLMRDKKMGAEKKIHYIIPIPDARAIQREISPESLESVHARLLQVVNFH
jgi:3-dehydroquinate synthase